MQFNRTVTEKASKRSLIIFFYNNTGCYQNRNINDWVSTIFVDLSISLSTKHNIEFRKFP